MRAAVVDVGSNSIKLLVADRGADGRPVEVASRTLEARIGTGIGSETPKLTDEAMARGVAAVASLVAEARAGGADTFSLVATSAVRDASNGAAFAEHVRQATGIGLRILTGLEEADGIGRGLTTDPALAGFRDFHVYDLGGGSLECLLFRAGSVETAASLPLGCVRLTERLVPHPSAPLGADVAAAIRAHVKAALIRSGFPSPVPAAWGVVGTGGTLTTARAMLGARGGTALGLTDPLIGIATLRGLLDTVAPLPLERRSGVPGLTASRADVFPTALVTLLALAEHSRISGFRHSLRNLRWGLAAQLLA